MPPFGPLPLPATEPITKDNIHRLQKIAAIGTGLIHPQAAWSPDGKVLAVPSSVGVWLYNADDWNVYPELLEAPIGGLQTLVYNPDGRLLYGGDRDGFVHVWDMPSKTHIASLDTELFEIAHLVLSPDGTRLAAADYQTGVILWQIDDQAANEGAFDAVQLSFNAITQVSHLHFTPDGTRLYTDGTQPLRLDVVMGEQLPDIPQIPSYVFELGFNFSPDGRLIAGQTQTNLQIWDMATGEQVQVLPVERARDMQFIDGGAHLLVGTLQTGVQLWDVNSGEKLQDLPGLSAYPQHIILSPDKRSVVYGSLAAVDVWSLETGENLLRRPSDTIQLRASGSIAFLPTGELIYINDSGNARGLWLADLDSVRFEQLSTTNVGREIAFNGRGDWLLTDGSPLRLWYVPERVLEAVYSHESNGAVAFHTDGQSYASGGSVVRIWDFETRKLTQAVGEEFGYVETLKYNKSGTRLASAQNFRNEGEDVRQRWVVVWDTDGYRPLLTLENRMEPLAFRPGSEHILVHECTFARPNGGLCETKIAHMTDTITETTLYTLPYEFNSPIFSADGSLLFGGTLDGNLVVLDAESGTELARRSAHLYMTQVALSPDGHYLVTMDSALVESGGTGIGWVWVVPVED